MGDFSFDIVIYYLPSGLQANCRAFPISGSVGGPGSVLENSINFFL